MMRLASHYQMMVGKIGIRPTTASLSSSSSSSSRGVVVATTRRNGRTLATRSSQTAAVAARETRPRALMSKTQCWNSRTSCSICINGSDSASSTTAVSFSWPPMQRCHFGASAAAAAGNHSNRQLAKSSKRNSKQYIPKATMQSSSPQVKVPQSMIRLMSCYSKLDVQAHWSMFGDMIRQQMAASSGNANNAVSRSAPLGLQKHRNNSNENVHTTTNDYDHSDDDAFDERIYKCPLHWPSILALAQQEYPIDNENDSPQQSTNTDKLQVAAYQMDRSTAATRTTANHAEPIEWSLQANKRPLKQQQQQQQPPLPRLEWKALTSLDDLTLGLPQGFVVANRIPILLRHANFYQESSLETRPNRSSTTATRMEHAIYGLLYQLKETGHVRHSDCEMKVASKSNKVDQIVLKTRDWVLQMASKQEALQDLLLSQPRALDHIVSCLHYDYFWQQQPDEHNDSSEDERNERRYEMKT